MVDIKAMSVAELTRLRARVSAELSERRAPPPVTHAELAYWYLRLNGFLQLNNYILHPAGRGAARTDADIVGVRFRYRLEMGLDHGEPMPDDFDTLKLTDDRVDVIIAEVKRNEHCKLNGPWTDPEKRNVDRLLAAIGCFQREQIADAANQVYRSGAFSSATIRVRLVAIGRDLNPGLAKRYADVAQVTWKDALTFIWHRFAQYRKEKGDVNQWIDTSGLWLKDASELMELDMFVHAVCSHVGIIYRQDRERANNHP